MLRLLPVTADICTPLSQEWLLPKHSAPSVQFPDVVCSQWLTDRRTHTHTKQNMSLLSQRGAFWYNWCSSVPSNQAKVRHSALLLSRFPYFTSPRKACLRSASKPPTQYRCFLTLSKLLLLHWPPWDFLVSCSLIFNTISEFGVPQPKIMGENVHCLWYRVEKEKFIG